VTPAWRCTKRVGFLFPHPCERLTPDGCPDCSNGSIADPWASRTDRRGYTDDYYVFDDFGSDSSSGASATSDTPVFGGGDSGGGGASMDYSDADVTQADVTAADFTEADGATLVSSGEAFEDDLSAS
jgi:hypothetical protein